MTFIQTLPHSCIGLNVTSTVNNFYAPLSGTFFTSASLDYLLTLRISFVALQQPIMLPKNLPTFTRFTGSHPLTP